ncbi:Hypothetical predicted protein, partial [Pelobates cultripes]
AENERPEEDHYNGPGLLWEALEKDSDFSSKEESRYWGIREYRMDALELPNTTVLGPDITRLVAIEWELEQ